MKSNYLRLFILKALTFTQKPPVQAVQTDDKGCNRKKVDPILLPASPHSPNAVIYAK